MGHSESIAEQVSELMHVSPDEFTRRRDALVRRLREDDQPEAASELALLRRPSPALWAVNQIADRAPDVIRDLLESGEALRHAQSRMLAGEEGVELTRPAEDHRQAVLRGVEAGRAALRASGRPATATMLARLRETLVGASLGERSRDALAEGRLVVEVPAASIGFAAAPQADRITRQEHGAKETVEQAGRRTAEERARSRRSAEDAHADAERLRDAALERLQAIQAEREHLERGHAAALRALAEAGRARADAEAAHRRALAEESAADAEAARAEERAGRARAEEATEHRALEEARQAVELARRRLRSLDRS